MLVLAFSCSTPGDQRVNTTGVLDNVYISSGVEQFFLGDLPHWVNFSQAGQCHRKTNIRFLEFKNLSKSYNLKYDQMIHLQHMFNRKIYAYKTSSAQKDLPLKDEGYVFYNVYQQVIGGSYDFVPPKFQKVSVVWVDPYLKQPKRLAAIFKQDKVLAGHPVLLSHCLTSYELEELAKELKLDDIGVKYLSADMMTVYNKQGDNQLYFAIDLEAFLAGKEVTVFSSHRSEEITGKVNFIEIP